MAEGAGTFVADAIGVNNGTLNLASTWSNGPFGTSWLPNAAGLVDCGRASSLDYTATSFTWVTWCYPLSMVANTPYGLVDHAQTTNPSNFWWRIGDIGLPLGEVQFSCGDGASERKVSSVTDITNNAWWQLAAVYDYQANAGSVYINGQLDNVVALTGSSGMAPPNNFNLILSFNFSGRQFPGYIDHVMTWSRALGSREISALYSDPFQMWKPRRVLKATSLPLRVGWRKWG